MENIPNKKSALTEIEKGFMEEVFSSSCFMALDRISPMGLKNYQKLTFNLLLQAVQKYDPFCCKSCHRWLHICSVHNLKAL